MFSTINTALSSALFYWDAPLENAIDGGCILKYSMRKSIKYILLIKTAAVFSTKNLLFYIVW